MCVCVQLECACSGGGGSCNNGFPDSISTANYSGVTLQSRSPTPGGPASAFIYPMSDCVLSIQAPVGQGLGVSVTINSAQGAREFLQVFDGASLLSPVLASFASPDNSLITPGARIVGSSVAGEMCEGTGLRRSLYLLVGSACGPTSPKSCQLPLHPRAHRYS